MEILEQNQPSSLFVRDRSTFKNFGLPRVIWLVPFMHYDLGYFDDETCRLGPIENPLIWPEGFTHVPGINCHL